MLNKPFYQKLGANLRSYTDKRRELIKQAGDAQTAAKRAIFALQRDSEAEADKLLVASKTALAALRKKYAKETRLFNEGSYKAALEELLEAEIFKQARAGQTLGPIKDLEYQDDDYVSGLADVPGELLRYAIKSATERKFDLVKRCHTFAVDIVDALIAMDLTGYHRQKFDQAKQALNKLEQIVYEISLKNTP